MPRLIAIALIVLSLVGCATPPPTVTSTGAIPPPTTTVNNGIAGIASLASADVQQGVNDLMTAGANTPTAPLPLVDSLTCGRWLLTAIPQAAQLTNGILPTSNAKGPYSLFIEGKIAVVNGKNAVSTAQGSFIDTFNHNCGAAVAGDVNAITVLLAKVGIQVAVPGSGLLGGLIPTL